MTDELNILIPDRTLTICGVEVTVHEYTLAEQLQHRQPLKAISEGFMDAMNAKPDAEVSIDELYDVLGANWDAVLQAVAVSCGRSVEWVAGLTGDDSESLLLIWWGVNADFFTRNAIRPALTRLVQQLQNPPPGERSSAASSTTATDSAICGTTLPAS
ncbi:Uncharacterised protein [Klebsiella pneumoniae]|uniref:Uncharacterized protein n=1 Tax=Klebsiella pneumoniae subsp. ozaenae TaxID=574 RepID=A0A378B0V6_KLEPO|nr:DUF6631 family protein [Klebsiella pneumoniae]MBU9719152.1 hypothetical protein [Klebsiella pneumoniae subsp. ozaenae]VFS27541.1 Uncharacterised protein [Serratia liquefaciens]STR97349.1 Uncharacterised protein [Klebsiella pneumoniae]STR99479.1 Uncharacterised protein [Klebsiella pneumoniae]STU38425.1 Uncharacterised protein [Klebsiella pneumoniae]